MGQMITVPFYGDQLFVVDHQGQPFTPARPIAEALGLDWGGQQQKFSNNDRWTVEMISTVAQDGRQREMLCIPVRKLPSWLAELNPKKVRADIRPKLIQYQNECDDVLWRYWTEGKAERVADGAAAPLLAFLEVEQSSTMDRLQAELRRTKAFTLALYEARPDWKRIARYQRLGLSKREITKLLGTSPARVNRIMVQMLALQLISARHMEHPAVHRWRRDLALAKQEVSHAP